jgi:hypothetical protein
VVGRAGAGPELRCSDADREAVAEQLRAAAGDGRLTLGELEDRLERAFGARTYADLEPLVGDLGGAAPAPPAGTPAAQPAGSRAAPAERIRAVLSAETRSGRWLVPEVLEVVACCGSCTLDLTQAVVQHRAVRIDARLWCSTLTVLVPEGIDVRLEAGANVLGDRRLRTPGRVTRGAPVLVVGGTVVLSTLTVRTPGRVAAVLRALFDA